MPTEPASDDEMSDAEEVSAAGGLPGPENGSDSEMEGCEDDADDEMEADNDDPPGAVKRKQSEKEEPDGKRKSKAHTDCKNPVEAEARRIRRIGRKMLRELDLRADIKIKVLNWVVLNLSGDERSAFRDLGAMEQEHYIAKRDCVDFLESHCFNALNSIDLRACEALSIRLINTIRERLACGADGKRLVICRPPSYTGAGNPLTQKSNREQGIKWEQKAVLVPFVFRNSSQIKAAADRVLDGRTLHLAYDFDGAAWDLWEQARDLLVQLEGDRNLLSLPTGVLRTLQLIFDGHGWNSRTGAVRFVLRCTQTEHDHNATRNARNPVFALGSDKHEWLEKLMRIGEEGRLPCEQIVSMRARMYNGLVVTERQEADMPAHVRADPDFLPLAMIECASDLASHACCYLPHIERYQFVAVCFTNAVQKLNNFILYIFCISNPPTTNLQSSGVILKSRFQRHQRRNLGPLILWPPALASQGLVTVLLRTRGERLAVPSIAVEFAFAAAHQKRTGLMRHAWQKRAGGVLSTRSGPTILVTRYRYLYYTVLNI